MADPKEIYLEPACCADPHTGRTWAADQPWDRPPECTDHQPATRYVRADIHEAALKRQAGAARTLQASTLETVRHLHEKDRSEYTSRATLESEREANARLTEEIERLRTLNAEMREALEAFVTYGCPVCGGDCASANPPVYGCPMRAAHAALSHPTPLAGGDDG